MKPSLAKLILSTGILIAGVLVGIFVQGIIGIGFMVAGIAGFFLTGGVDAYKDTFFNRY